MISLAQLARAGIRFFSPTNSVQADCAAQAQSKPSGLKPAYTGKEVGRLRGRSAQLIGADLLPVSGPPLETMQRLTTNRSCQTRPCGRDARG